MLTTALLAETIMNEGAQKCGLSNEAIRQRNLIPSGYRTPYGQIVPKSHFPRIWDEGLAKSEYAKRREKVDLFNAGSRWTKRGLALIPTMYGGEQLLAKRPSFRAGLRSHIPRRCVSSQLPGQYAESDRRASARLH